jgi:hypothetical protein
MDAGGQQERVVDATHSKCLVRMSQPPIAMIEKIPAVQGVRIMTTVQR